MGVVLKREIGGSEIERIFLAGSVSLATLAMHWEAEALALHLKTIVQEDADGHLHVVKAVDHKGVGAEFFVEEVEWGE